MSETIKPLFDAVAYFWFRQIRLYRLFGGGDTLYFAYVGLPEGARGKKPPKYYATTAAMGIFGSLFAGYFRRRDFRRHAKYEAEATAMLERIGEAADGEQLLALHPHNFSVRASDIVSSKFVPSLFSGGYGRFWTFRMRTGEKWAFRLDACGPGDQNERIVTGFLSRGSIPTGAVAN